MATACIPQITFGFEPKEKPIVATFDMPHASSDGGAVLLKSLDTQLQLTKRLAGCLVDGRQPGKVQHQTLELVRQRVFGLACGYADCNDAARLAEDAIHKLLLDRDPIAGAALASQPTLSRFENAVDWEQLAGHGACAGRHRDRDAAAAAQGAGHPDHDRPGPHRRPDPRPAGVHVLQRPLRHVVLPADRGDRDLQRRGGAVRGGRRCCGPATPPATRGARGILRRLLGKLRDAFPTATFRVRLDGGFAHPKLFTFLEQQQVEYVVAMASNARLEKRARRLMGKARMLSKATGETAHLYGETRYAARKWTRKRRVIIKAEVVRHPGRDPKNNPRFVVTNLADAPETVYHFYCGRGDVENRLKELHHGLEMDRTSCERFLANQFRVLLTLAAYVLFQELRRRAAGTACADAQVTTLRERLLKLAVWVERSVRRIVLHLPATFPWLPTWQQIARAVGATT